jgi:FMN phosphatase YigB (HAD superfamily)
MLYKKGITVLIDTILFDLDGTLIPMDQEEFIAAYFSEITKKFVPRGYEKELLISSIWSGTKAMVENRGERTNSEEFWARFSSFFGESVLNEIPVFDEFYLNEFDRVKRVVTKTEASKKIVKALEEKGYSLILATNPVFPLNAVKTRLSWIGLDISRFEYVTTYENCRHCKPSLEYYREILNKTGKVPQQCMMVGNNADEDMCAEELGIAVHLIEGFVENKNNTDMSRYKRSTLEGFLEICKSMPTIAVPLI